MSIAPPKFSYRPINSPSIPPKMSPEVRQIIDESSKKLVAYKHQISIMMSNKDYSGANLIRRKYMEYLTETLNKLSATTHSNFEFKPGGSNSIVINEYLPDRNNTYVVSLNNHLDMFIPYERGRYTKEGHLFHPEMDSYRFKKVPANSDVLSTFENVMTIRKYPPQISNPLPDRRKKPSFMYRPTMSRETIVPTPQDPRLGVIAKKHQIQLAEEQVILERHMRKKAEPDTEYDPEDIAHYAIQESYLDKIVQGFEEMATVAFGHSVTFAFFTSETSRQPYIQAQFDDKWSHALLFTDKLEVLVSDPIGLYDSMGNYVGDDPDLLERVKLEGTLYSKYPIRPDLDWLWKMFQTDRRNTPVRPNQVPSFTYKPKSMPTILPPKVMSPEYRKSIELELIKYNTDISQKRERFGSKSYEFRHAVTPAIQYIQKQYALYMTAITGDVWRPGRLYEVGDTFSFTIKRPSDNVHVVQYFVDGEIDTVPLSLLIPATKDTPDSEIRTVIWDGHQTRMKPSSNTLVDAKWMFNQFADNTKVVQPLMRWRSHK